MNYRTANDNLRENRNEHERTSLSYDSTTPANVDGAHWPVSVVNALCLLLQLLRLQRVAAIAAISLRQGRSGRPRGSQAANQLIGFAFLGYPLRAMSFVWGAVIGAAMIGFPGDGSRLPWLPALSAPLAFVTAFTVFRWDLCLSALAAELGRCGRHDFLDHGGQRHRVRRPDRPALRMKAIFERPSRIVGFGWLNEVALGKSGRRRDWILDSWMSAAMYR